MVVDLLIYVIEASDGVHPFVSDTMRCMGAPCSRFLSYEDFLVWNERMTEKYHPSLYHQSSSRLVRWVEEKRVRAILQSVSRNQPQRVLDVGCGAGHLLERIAAKTVWGVDISQGMAREAAARLGSRATIMQGDATQLDTLLCGEKFNTICCSEVLEHVLEPSRVLEAMKRSLLPGGHIVVSVPNERLINRCKSVLWIFGLFRLLLGSTVAWRMEREWHLHIFNKQECSTLFREAGLKIASLRGIPYNWLPLRFVITTHAA